MGVDDIDFYTRTYEGRGIVLNGAEGVPKKQEPLGTIYFLPGISAIWSDYTPLIVPLAKRFRVCTYDQRGHGSSPGKFDVNSAADDLESIIAKDGTRPAGIIGHSISCKIAVDVAKRFEKDNQQLQGVYMVQPVLGSDFLNWPQRAVVHLLYGLTPALRFVDDVLNEFKNLRKLNGLNNRDFLAGYGSVARVDSAECTGLDTPISYMLANGDVTLGLSSKKHYFRCVSGLSRLFPSQTSVFPSLDGDSSYVRGLNHCLNRKGFVPFLKSEKHKNKDAVVFAIESFFYNAFSEKH